jgi:hypothetical protein
MLFLVMIPELSHDPQHLGGGILFSCPDAVSAGLP